jgi:hypothetical protein
VTKETLFGIIRYEFADRGISCLIIDTPGTGEPLACAESLHARTMRSRPVRSSTCRRACRALGSRACHVRRIANDAELRALVQELSTRSLRFRTLWETRNVSFYREERKVVEHPAHGPLVLDWAILDTQMTDLRVVLVTAEPGSYSTQVLTRMRAEVTGPADRPKLACLRSGRPAPPSRQGDVP